MTTTTDHINPFEVIDQMNKLVDNNDFDENGMHLHTGKPWNRRGFLVDGTHRKTGTTRNPAGIDCNGYDIDGYHRSGWNSEGLNRTTGTRFNEDGLDIHGFDKDGWEGDGYRPWNAFTENEWLRSEANHREGQYGHLPIHKETKTFYAPDGYNLFGFDADGYDRRGFDRIGDDGTYVGYNREGFDPQGYNENGYNRRGFNLHGYDRLGFDASHIHAKTGTVWSPDWIHGGTRKRFDPEGYDIDGDDANSCNREGYDIDGFTADRIHKDTGTPYNSEGLTREHLDKEGFRINDLGERIADGWKYRAGEKAPTRVFNLSHFNHHVTADKLRTDDTDYRGRTPRNLQREGWMREPGQGWDVGKGIYVIEKSFTHKDTGTECDPQGFNVIGINADRVNERGFNVNTRKHVITGTEYDTEGWNYLRDEKRVG